MREKLQFDAQEIISFWKLKGRLKRAKRCRIPESKLNAASSFFLLLLHDSQHWFVFMQLEVQL
jgi:hypothetical protein